MSAHILLMEDTEDLGEMIRDILSIKGYQVRWAKDGKTGMQLFYESKPDLVITDIFMPYLNGLEVIREIRKKEDATKMPIIILSARTSPEDEAIGFKAGASLYLKKPCSSSFLVESVSSLLPPG